jgi:predicted porin
MRTSFNLSNVSSVLRTLLAVAITLAISAGAASAQTSDKALHIHGFGDWIYGRTNGNLFQSADHDGNYGDAAFGLNLRYDAGERVAIIGQFALEHTTGDTNQTVETRLDYAFAQYTVSDKLHIRFGRTYHPFGLYGEIRDIGTARPFIERPPEVYGDLGIISAALEGADFYGDVLQSSAWRMHYDVYGGATELSVAEPQKRETHTETIKAVIGAKIVFETPIDGLHLSASAFRGTREDIKESHRSDALSVEYSNERWLVRAEAAEHQETSDSVKSAYVEGAFRPAGPWQITARLGSVHQSFAEATVDSTFLRHRAAGIGLNYWFDPKVVVKAEFHSLSGNRLALPDPKDGGVVRRKTRAVEVGVQFSF